jgi:hypothetical protein
VPSAFFCTLGRLPGDIGMLGDAGELLGNVRIPVKLDSRSGANWSLVPEQSDQPSERSDARWSL